MLWKASIYRASTSDGTPVSIVAIVTVSALLRVSLPIVMRRAMVRADGAWPRHFPLFLIGGDGMPIR
ncbi:hypothetical protein [Acidocella aminolytica]|uniref:hypothetical protein n=1 Tax=Acidocella aminolytica TaxID=33998 RepID=UPI000662A956